MKDRGVVVVVVVGVGVGSLKLAEWISWKFLLFDWAMVRIQGSSWFFCFLRLLKTCGRRDTSRFFGRSASPTWTRGRCSIESSIFLLL